MQAWLWLQLNALQTLHKQLQPLPGMLKQLQSLGMLHVAHINCKAMSHQMLPGFVLVAAPPDAL